MTTFFILMLLIVQVGMLAVTRSTIETSVDAAARRAALAPERAPEIEARLRDEIDSLVQGAEIAELGVRISGAEVKVAVTLRWRPPGPDFIPINVRVSRMRSVVVPP
jgi:hypothetical protein